jgi:protein O-GlcNAc transferase
MSSPTETLIREAVGHHVAGRLEKAARIYARVRTQYPRHFEALHLGGRAAYQLQDPAQAVDLFQKALGVKPRSAETLMFMGLALMALGRHSEAEEKLDRGIGLDPGNPEAWGILGGFRLMKGRTAEAMTCYQKAVGLNPSYAPGWVGVGAALVLSGRGAEAVEPYETALKLEPGDESARLALVQALQACHRIGEALSQCDRLIAARPANHQALGHRLFLLNYLADIPRERSFEECQAYGRLLPAPVLRRFPNSRDPNKRLRVAFLSPDLRTHPVAFFLVPLLAHLDAGSFEIVLYQDYAIEDGFSARLRQLAAVWRNFGGQGDAAVESAILSDKPDILVDLVGHTGAHRLTLFARRLAPVQVTYLGYPATTGVPAIDFRFTDPIADPEGEADRFHTEKLVRFSECAWAFSPPDSPPLSLPCAEPGAPVSFGSFNSLSKVNDTTLALWARVLEAVPDSRLVIKSPGLEPDRLRPRLSAAGIDPDRCVLLAPEPEIADHLRCYRHVDIALDPTPYGGTTTTCEALWMGRPVVTLAGDRHVSRVGASLLTAAGKMRWIAHSSDDYVAIATDLASDRAHLIKESATLKGILLSSRILDHGGQAGRFGKAFRACWLEFCSANPSSEASQ